MGSLAGPKAGGKATAIKLRKEAVERYYANPNYCLYCGKIIEVHENQKIRETRVKKFCNCSCAAKYNNKFVRKRTLKAERPKKVAIFRVNENVTLASLLGKGASKYALVREKARKKLCFYGVEKKCAVCGYSLHVEIHHRKGCREFPDDTLLSEVNQLDNLVYLCRNHHYEADHGYIEV